MKLKWFYQMASPKYFYHSIAVAVDVFFLLGMALLLMGWGWGLFIAPPDYQQGDAFRIMYVHVPCAFLSLMIYALMGGMAVSYLVWRIKLMGAMLLHCAEMGAAMTFLALVTGGIWGKPMWGTYWVWDARLTSELILFLLYLGMLSARSLYVKEEQSDKVLAILALIGLIDLPIIHYSVYWWNTLHQGATISFFAKPKIALSMLYPLLLSMLGMGLFSFGMILFKTRVTLLWRERRQPWVQKVWNEYGAI
jgi:heme exporter protein C